MAGDWYNVHQIVPGLTAIGEPRYEQQNWSYLIEGSERALLFDTGSWFGDMAGLVAGLTDKPLRVLPSHMHYDHLGSVHRFDDVVLPDLPVLRACEADGCVTPTEALFLGSYEGHEAPCFAVAEWLEIGAEIDLGGVVLRLMHTPGHSPDSVSLWWPEADILLAADYLYHGPLFAQVPGASLGDYLATARALLGVVGDKTAIYGAHGDAADAGTARAPMLDRGDLEALADRLDALHVTEPPKAEAEHPVSERCHLLVGAEAFNGF